MRNTRESDATGPRRPGCPPRRRGPARRGGGPIALAAAAALAGGVLQTAPAPAAEFDGDGYQGSLDTIVSHGLTVRVEGADSELTGDTNGNDGNLNYDRGIVSNASKFSSDFDLRAGDFGVFVRAAGFIDFENENGERGHSELSAAALERVGSDVEILDAYVTAAFDAGDMPIDVRLGRHVLNWGESTFIPNGINAVNPFDVSKLRLPGSELREALLPVGLASVAVAPTDNLSVEGFYQFDWAETRIDPVGSYFSTVDYAGPGAREAVITQVTKRDDGHEFGPLAAVLDSDLAGLGLGPPIATDEDFASVLRGADRTPDDSGQWGLAVRYFAEDLNGTEFGLHFINYHSRLPVVGAFGAEVDYILAGLTAAGAISAPTSNTVAALSARIATEVAPQVTPVVTEQVQQAVRAGLVPAEAAPGLIEQQARQEVEKIVAEQLAGPVGDLVGAVALNYYAKGGQYFLEYPEDLQLLGLSFNTVLGASGWALQGEYSFRPDTPLQRAERKVLEDGLRPIITALTLGAKPTRRRCPAISGPTSRCRCPAT